MIKKTIISLVFLILLVGGGLFFYVDSIVKSGIEVVGTQVLGANVTVDSVSISPLSGTGSLRGLRVGNPEGFNSDYAFQLEEVSITLNTSSVFEDVVEIENVTILQPEINYETRITTDNIRALIANITGGSSAASSANSGDAGAGKQIIIREFRMLDPQLNVVATVITAPVPLPDIELNDIGAEAGSTSVAQALDLILSTLSRSVLRNQPSLDGLLEGVESAIEDRVEDAAEALTNRLRSILN